MKEETKQRREAAMSQVVELAKEIAAMSGIAYVQQPLSASEKHNNRLWWEERANKLMFLGKEITCDDANERVEQPKLAVGNLLQLWVKGVENNPVLGRYLSSKGDTSIKVTLKSIARYYNGTVYFNDQDQDFNLADLIKPIEVVNL